MNSILTDLSAITAIPKLTLDKLIYKANLCISDNILDNLLNKNSVTSMNIGIGELIVKIQGDEIKYKFIPSKDLDQLICSTINSKKSPLETTLELSLNDRIRSTYKELL